MADGDRNLTLEFLQHALHGARAAAAAHADVEFVVVLRHVCLVTNKSGFVTERREGGEGVVRGCWLL